MFFATSRLGSRKQSAQSGSFDLHEVTEELTHPGRVLFTEEVILGVCMVITGLLYLFAQMPGTMLTTATAGKSLMKQSVAGFNAAPSDRKPFGAEPLMAAAQPMLKALRQVNELEQRRDFGPAAAAAWETVRAAIEDLRFQPVAMQDRVLPLWMLEAEIERAAMLEARLEAGLGPYRDAIRSLREAELSPEQIAAAAVPAGQRSDHQIMLAAAVDEAVNVPWEAAVAAAPAAKQTEFEALCRLLGEARDNARAIARSRDVVNLDYWMATAMLASTPEGLRARAALTRADRAGAAGDLVAAEAAYEEGLTAWQSSLIANPQLAAEPAVVAEISRQIEAYRAVLEGLGQPFNDAFSLQNVLRTGT